MRSENLDFHYLKNFIKLALGGQWLEGFGSINIVCFPAGTLDKEGPDASRITRNLNRLDEYNDTIVIARRNPKSYKGEIYAAQGTVDPGKYYAVGHPHPEGAAHLCWGQHQMEPYRRQKDNRLVLRGINNVTRFWRDPDKDARQGLAEPVFTQAIGQWFHAMGKGKSIGKWSAGCIGPRGGYGGPAWQKVLEWLNVHPKGKHVVLTLWGLADYCKFHADYRHQTGPLQFDLTLRMGIRDLTGYGPVRRLQRLLAGAGCSPGKVDGDWMHSTQHSFLEFQRSEGLAVDGICGPKSWAKLKLLNYGG